MQRPIRWVNGRGRIYCSGTEQLGSHWGDLANGLTGFHVATLGGRMNRSDILSYIPLIAVNLYSQNFSIFLCFHSI